jgi:hypothetical protein
MRRRAFLLPMLLALLCYGCASAPAANPSSDYHQEISAGLEEVYINRTVRTEHIRGGTPACSAAPFTVANEDVYETWSMELQSSDGRVVDTHRQKTGSFRICIGQLAAGRPFGVYMITSMGSTPHTAVGECTAAPAQPPLKTLAAFNCVAKIEGLPPDYAGGAIVTSTLAPVLGANQPVDAHVPGFLSTSVIVTRLWKKPKT